MKVGEHTRAVLGGVTLYTFDVGFPLNAVSTIG